MYSGDAGASFDLIVPWQSRFNDLLLKLQHFGTQQSNLVPNDVCQVWRNAEESKTIVKLPQESTCRFQRFPTETNYE